VKTTACAAFFLGILFLAPIFSYAGSWKPVSEFTEFECGIVSAATKKPCERVLRGADYFVAGEHLVIIQFINGDVGYFASGGKNFAAKKIEEEKSENISGGESSEWKRANEAWSRVYPKLSEPLTEDTKNDLDFFVAVAVLDPNPIQISGVPSILAVYGNKFIGAVRELLPMLSSSKYVTALMDYIMSPNASGHDMPSDDEKRLAIYDMQTILMNDGGLRVYLLNSEKREIQRLDPVTFQFLDDAGKIEQNTGFY